MSEACVGGQVGGLDAAAKQQVQYMIELRHGEVTAGEVKAGTDQAPARQPAGVQGQAGR
jgi:hypothetical protein